MEQLVIVGQKSAFIYSCEIQLNAVAIIVLLVKRNTLILYSYFHRTYMFFFLLLLLSVMRLANYQNTKSQILGLWQ